MSNSNLYLSCKRGELEALKELLLSESMYINDQSSCEIGDTPLCIVAYSGDVAMFRELLKCSLIDINVQNKEGDTPLIMASAAGHIEIVELLLNAHANVNIQNKIGKTALIAACRERTIHQHDIITALLTAGADTELTYGEGNTALIGAAYYGHLGAVKLLLDHGANVNAVDKSGMSALMNAAEAGNVDMANLLLSRGAIVNQQCQFGWTALMLACKTANESHYQVVRLLLGADADMTMLNEAGDDVFYIAKSSGFRAAINILVSSAK